MSKKKIQQKNIPFRHNPDGFQVEEGSSTLLFPLTSDVTRRAVILFSDREKRTLKRVDDLSYNLKENGFDSIAIHMPRILIGSVITSLDFLPQAFLADYFSDAEPFLGNSF